MDKHRDIEITRAEQTRDVRPDLVAGGVVVLAPGLDGDHPAVGQQDEMVDGCLMRKTHGSPWRSDAGRMLVSRDMILILHAATHHRVLSMSAMSVRGR